MIRNKTCTGYACEKKERCYLYDPKPEDPFNCISPLARYEECPYYAPHPTWGEGADGVAND